MLHFVQNIIILYIINIRQQLSLLLIQKPLAVFDVIAAQRVDSMQIMLTEANIKFIYVLAGCTG